MTKNKHVAAVAGGVLFAVAALAPAVSFANVVSSVAVDHATYTNPATVNFAIVAAGGYDIPLYLNSGSAPVAYASDIGNLATSSLNSFSFSTGSFDGMTNGSYELLAVNQTACTALSYAACVAANSGGGQSGEADFMIASSGGGGSTSTEATSTPDQIQQDWLGVTYLYFAMVAFTIWLLRKRH